MGFLATLGVAARSSRTWNAVPSVGTTWTSSADTSSTSQRSAAAQKRANPSGSPASTHTSTTSALISPHPVIVTHRSARGSTGFGGRSRRAGRAERQGAERPRRPRLVEAVDLDDLEAGVRHQVRDAAGQVAAAEEAALERFQPVLPPLHPGVRSEAVLDE